MIPPELHQRCQKVRMLLMDVDGVLTDGGITCDSDGKEIKTFHVRDGLGIKLWMKAGKWAGIVSGRSSPVVKRRAAELGITALVQGADDKRPAFARLLGEYHLSADAVCYVGDDLPDLPLIRQAGVGVAVADACEEARRAAHYVTQAAGGKGAVRELIELLLKAQGLWAEVLGRFAG